MAIEPRESLNFHDFMTDKDGSYSKAHMVAAASKLVLEGRRPERIIRGMMLATSHIAMEAKDKYSWWDYVTMLKKYADFLYEETDKLCDEIEANRSKRLKEIQKSKFNHF